MNIGIVGTGRMARARTRALAAIDGAEIHAICSRHSDSAVEFIGELGLGMAEPVPFDRMIADPGLDAVFVTGPNRTHAAESIAVLEAGKHLFLEYPAAIDPEAAAEIETVWRRGKSALHLGLTHRYGEAAKVRRELFSGRNGYDLGEPVSFQRAICSGNPISRWYDDDTLSGGMFVASMFHYLDDCRALFGEVVHSSAVYRAKRTPASLIRSDSASVQLSCDSGVAVQISYARGMDPPGIGSRITAVFEHGYYIEDSERRRVVTPEGSFDFDLPEGDPIGADTQAFFDLVASGRRSDGSFEEGMKSLVLASELQNSAE